MRMCMSCLNQYSESAQPDHRVLAQPVAQHMSSRTLVLLGTPEHCNPVQQDWTEEIRYFPIPMMFRVQFRGQA